MCVQIGLLDKPTGKHFWYNLLDNASFWMSDEDQERYLSLLAQGQHDSSLSPLSNPQSATHEAKVSSKELKQFRQSLGNEHS
jgi:hypothetical protein